MKKEKRFSDFFPTCKFLIEGEYYNPEINEAYLIFECSNFENKIGVCLEEYCPIFKQ